VCVGRGVGENVGRMRGTEHKSLGLWRVQSARACRWLSRPSLPVLCRGVLGVIMSFCPLVLFLFLFFVFSFRFVSFFRFFFFCN